MLNVINQCINSPITSILIILLLYIYIKIIYNEIDTSSLLSSYNNIIIKKQFYRILSNVIIHYNILHFIINIITLWQIRKIELIVGYYCYHHYPL